MANQQPTLQLLSDTHTHSIISCTTEIYQYSENTLKVLSFPFHLPHTHKHACVHTHGSLSALIGSGKSKLGLHCMFVYVILSVLLVVIQLRAVRLREARFFKGHYEPCQQATQSQHTLGPGG